MAMKTDNPEQYAKTWFYLTLASVVIYGTVVYAFIFRN
jgi:cytochrome oxidase assembly protein ShyY1